MTIQVGVYRLAFKQNTYGIYAYIQTTYRTHTHGYLCPALARAKERKNIITFWVFFVMANCLFAAAREWAKVAKKKRGRKKK